MLTDQEVFTAANALPEAERVRLIEVLLETLESEPLHDDPDQVAAEWQELAARRAAELETGQVQGVPWDEVRQMGERLLRDRSH